MDKYTILEVVKEWDESGTIIAWKNVTFKLQNDETREIVEKTIVFNALINLYDLMRDKYLYVVQSNDTGEKERYSIHDKGEVLKNSILAQYDKLKPRK